MRKRKRKAVSILAVLLIGAGFAFCCRKPVLHQAHDQIHRLRKLWEAEAIHFTYWQSKTPDVCAWIRVLGTEIDYPVLQNETKADDYYLSHEIEKESKLYGGIYIEKENNKAFTDLNTVLYGHNMRDGTMFGSLKKFTEKAFFDYYHVWELPFSHLRTLKYAVLLYLGTTTVYSICCYDMSAFFKLYSMKDFIFQIHFKEVFCSRKQE